MATHTIKYQGREETIELTSADVVRAGLIIPIVKRTLKYKVGQPLPDIDAEEWMIGIATNCITKAPWELKSPDAIRNLDFPTYEQLRYIIGDEYPLERFLSLDAKSMYGKKLSVVVESGPQTESTMNVSSLDIPSGK